MDWTWDICIKAVYGGYVIGAWFDRDGEMVQEFRTVADLAHVDRIVTESLQSMDRQDRPRDDAEKIIKGK